MTLAGIFRFLAKHQSCGIIIGKDTEMAKKKGECWEQENCSEGSIARECEGQEEQGPRMRLP